MTTEAEETKTNGSGPGDSPADGQPRKLSMAFHPERLGLRPQGRFPEGWQARKSTPHPPLERTAHGTPHEIAIPKRRPKAGADTGRDGAGRRYERRIPDSSGTKKDYEHGHTRTRTDTVRKPCGEKPPQADGNRKKNVWNPDEGYSSTCCGKCEYFQRVWRTSVWACDNSESKNHRFPVDYGCTCECFKRATR